MRPIRKTTILYTILLTTCFLTIFYMLPPKRNSSGALKPLIISSSRLQLLEIDEETYVKRWNRYKNYRDTESQRRGPGELGAPVPLTAEETPLFDDMFKKEGFNKFASEKISLDRSLMDARSSQCRAKTYSHNLPTTSVIIIFTNESWTPLLRTAHSVVNRTPPKYLKEVIFLDDASGKEELGSKLDEYVATQWPDGIVRIVRHKERLGLILARQQGAVAATGDVIVFLDSHCEVNTGWLEPQLERIKHDRTIVTCPSIESISDHTMAFQGSSDSSSVGSFWWSMFFTWDSIPPHEKARRSSSTDPIRSPTMAGGLFAMDRKYFFELGGYDPGMKIWGAENLEISFRIWMCGGSLEFIPCSKVGHIFRSIHPYSFPGHLDYNGMNTKRLAEVWLDDYKRLFYLYRPDTVNLDAGDYSDRIALRKRLNCKSFKWYLDNVIPEKFIPDENVTAYGMLSNPATSMCLDYLDHNEFDRPTIPAGIYFCQDSKSTKQIYSLTLNGEIRREWWCLTKTAFSDSLKLKTCSGSELWSHDKNTKMITEKYSSKCLDVDLPSKVAVVRNCDVNSPTQKWTWQYQLL